MMEESGYILFRWLVFRSAGFPLGSSLSNLSVIINFYYWRRAKIKNTYDFLGVYFISIVKLTFGIQLVIQLKVNLSQVE